jgi:hypothetical protein
MDMTGMKLYISMKTEDMVFSVSKSGFMYIDQGVDRVEIGPESVATLDAFIKELENIKRYIGEQKTVTLENSEGVLNISREELGRLSLAYLEHECYFLDNHFEGSLKKANKNKKAILSAMSLIRELLRENTHD